MGWTLGGTRFIVTDNARSAKNIIARLQPVAGGTIMQKFGYEDAVFKVQGFVVGSGDLSNIMAMAASASTYALNDFDGVTVMTGFVSSVNVTEVLTISQTIRPDLACDAPVYRVEVELYE